MTVNSHIKAIFVLPLFFLYLQAFGQASDTFQRLQSKGTMPEDFFALLSDKYEADKQQIDQNQRARDRRIQKQFYLESNFSIKELVTSGNVLFNDPISNYLNEIYQKIKASNPILSDKNIRFYTSKSTIINAYTTHAGIIFFNVGLIAKLKTEDEIAYIMCHEISHFLKKHNIKQYTFNEELASNKRLYRKMDWEDKMFSKANYSQQHEMEADSMGLVLFANCPYNIEASVDALNNLKTYRLPFDRKAELKKTVFENQHISFPEQSLIVLDSITVEEYEHDAELSTHPEVQTRVDSLKVLIEQLGKEEHQIGQANRQQKTAQFEMCHLFLERGMAFHAIYCCEALMQEFPENNYLHSVLAKTYYTLAQDRSYNTHHRITNRDNAFHSFYTDYRDNMSYDATAIQQVYYFVKTLNPRELNGLAMTTMWEQFENDTSAVVTKTRVMQLMGEYLDYYESDDTANVHPAAVLEKNNKDFALLMADVEELINNNDEDDEWPSKENEELPLRLLIISPEYRKFDERKEESYRFEASEKALIDYQTHISDNAQKSGINFELLSPVNLDSGGVSSINDIALVKNYFREMSRTSPITQVSNKEAILDLTKRHGTDKLVLLGTYAFHHKKTFFARTATVLLTTIYFPLLPFGVWYAIMPKFKTMNYFYVIDLLDEEILFEDFHRIKTRDNLAAINSSMYYNYLRIKRLPR